MGQIDRNLIANFFESDGKDVFENALKTLRQNNMEELISGGVLVGLSGGADSCMLLYFLLEYRRRCGGDFSIVAAHLNHMIRGEEADRDEAFCHSLCNSLGVELIAIKFDVPAYALDNSLGIEEAARNVRYSHFEKIISSRNDLGCIAIAHNLSDSAETVLFNILRGCGTRGAGGIRPVRDNIVRPLINLSKSDILSTLDSFGLNYVTDGSNFNIDFTRNYIRNELIPMMNKICDNPEKMLCRFAGNLRDDDDYLESLARDFLHNNKEITNKALLSIDYPIFVRVISLMANENSCGISSSIIADVYSNLSKNNFSYSIIGGRFICERGVCRITNGEEKEINFFTEIELGEGDIPPLGIKVILSEENPKEIYPNVYNFSIQANLSSAIIEGRLYFRPKMDGDSVYYGGMTHKLKKLFNDRKFSLNDKLCYPVLCDDKGVVWAPGFGVRDDGVESKNRKDLFIFLGSMTPYRFFNKGMVK